MHVFSRSDPSEATLCITHPYQTLERSKLIKIFLEPKIIVLLLNMRDMLIIR